METNINLPFYTIIKMVKIVVIEKSGSTKTVNLKEFSGDIICKKLGIKSFAGFTLQHTWGEDVGLDQNIGLYAKTEGRAGQENKYDFPPPVDKRLFFGPCALVGRNPETGEFVDLDKESWEEIYEFLFGGFDDVGSSDTDDDSEEEEDEVKGATTKQGYVKDGFIVESDEEEEDAEEEEEESEKESEESSDSEFERTLKKKKQIRKPRTTKKKTATQQSVEPVVVATPQIEDCEEELVEEEYD